MATGFVGRPAVHLFQLIAMRSAIGLAEHGIKMSRHGSVWQAIELHTGRKFTKRTAAQARAYLDELIAAARETVTVENDGNGSVTIQSKPLS